MLPQRVNNTLKFFFISACSSMSDRSERPLTGSQRRVCYHGQYFRAAGPRDPHMELQAEEPPKVFLCDYLGHSPLEVNCPGGHQCNTIGKTGQKMNLMRHHERCEP